jgi:hypothetical protein
MSAYEWGTRIAWREGDRVRVGIVEGVAGSHGTTRVLCSVGEYGHATYTTIYDRDVVASGPDAWEAAK